ncbi:hypothetical protein FOXG_18972 [Fusarium oxysporum f. sp. lycopersici 4287]|uniref:Uncharacterized protein n=2 Tax=Fusarium oxysporum TaxID=5507 RepID=A0A0J9URL3_FUSO4|nr:hypothetical protein FOXG_18972 [Fusarium oxysporum f. sp. lycopersici 4287]EXK38873.1 hypothetical protein FOMG_06381 [Fusarium oxysporum f. sp. melonis 26406]KNB01940.1 hypothetical protein FOXG_18972 [Fusarium oxysporum f. sp. lycopersici 4287]
MVKRLNQGSEGIMAHGLRTDAEDRGKREVTEGSVRAWQVR